MRCMFGGKALFCFAIKTVWRGTAMNDIFASVKAETLYRVGKSRYALASGGILA